MPNTYRTVFVNADGLPEFLGVGESYSGNGGEYRTLGGQRQIEIDIPDMTKIPTGTGFILDDTVYVPKGAFIEQVTLVTKIAVTSGGSATLNVGTIGIDRSSAQTTNGFLAAVTLASITAVGTTIVYRIGSTGVGAYVGTALAANGLFVANWGTAAFTAGAIALRIDYSFLSTFNT